jgi:hypothetical protein
MGEGNRVSLDCGCGKVDPPPTTPPAEPKQTERVSV